MDKSKTTQLLRLLGKDAEWLHTQIFEFGVLYLDNRFPGNPELALIYSQSRFFWDWYTSKFNTRCEILLYYYRHQEALPSEALTRFHKIQTISPDQVQISPFIHRKITLQLSTTCLK